MIVIYEKSKNLNIDCCKFSFLLTVVGYTLPWFFKCLNSAFAGAHFWRVEPSHIYRCRQRQQSYRINYCRHLLHYLMRYSFYQHTLPGFAGKTMPNGTTARNGAYATIGVFSLNWPQIHLSGQNLSCAFDRCAFCEFSIFHSKMVIFPCRAPSPTASRLFCEHNLLFCVVLLFSVKFSKALITHSTESAIGELSLCSEPSDALYDWHFTTPLRPADIKSLYHRCFQFSHVMYFTLVFLLQK